ncbi:RDD family protein [Microbacterium sp. 2MCAF23]|uniref:RDD family protein n=1 Tax=Microbacterium sp. 2MCAF23 TaxID=3232985 RepID=UPI003F947D92
MTNAPTGTGSAAAPVAPIARRAIAYVIDAAIAGVLWIVGTVVTYVVAGSRADGLSALFAAVATGLGITAGVLLVWLLIYSFLQGSGGSVGMRIMKLKLVRDGSEAPLGFGRALLRNVVFGLSATIIVGYFTPLFDGSGRFQGWHDSAAGALMRDVRTATPAPAGSAPAPGGAPLLPAAPAGLFVPGATAPAAAAPASFASPQQGALFPASDSGSLFPSAAPVGPQDGHTGFTLPGAPAPVASAPAGGSEPALAGTAAPGSPAAAEVDPHDVTVLSPAAQAAAAAAHEGAMITMVPGVSPSVPAPAPAPVSGPETVAPARPPVPAAAPASVEAAMALPPVAQPAEDDEDLEETRISIPGHRLQFVWDDGARATVSGRTLFGRNPAPEAGAIVVVVRDETLSLSKTHFEAAAEAAGGWVMDRHSTNGMTIVRDGVRIACPPGERVRIRLGDAIEIGDRIVTVGGYA